MIKLGMTVKTKKGLNGVITKIITKSTGYVEVTLEDGKKTKEMAFNLTDENGNPVRKAPKAAQPKPLSPIDALKNRLMQCNCVSAGDRNSLSWQMCEEDLSTVWTAAEKAGNVFIQAISDTCTKYMRCSEKQAYYMARFCIENNITLK